VFARDGGVRAPGSRPLALIYPSSITDVSAVIYELRGARGARGEAGTWLEVAKVMVCVCVCVDWGYVRLYPDLVVCRGGGGRGG